MDGLHPTSTVGMGAHAAGWRRASVPGRARSRRGQPWGTGLTLLEMLAVLAIAALLAAAALPSLQQVLARQQVRAAATDLFSAIELTAGAGDGAGPARAAGITDCP